MSLVFFLLNFLYVCGVSPVLSPSLSLVSVSCYFFVVTNPSFNNVSATCVSRSVSRSVSLCVPVSARPAAYRLRLIAAHDRALHEAEAEAAEPRVRPAVVRQCGLPTPRFNVEYFVNLIIKNIKRQFFIERNVLSKHISRGQNVSLTRMKIYLS